MLLVATVGIVALAAAWGRVNRAMFADLFSPFNLLLVAWVGPLALRGLHLSDREQPWPLSTLAIMLSVTALLAFGVLLLRPHTRITDAQRAAFAQLLTELRRPALLMVLGAIYAVSFLGYLYNEFYTNPVGIPVIAYLRDPTTALGNYHRWGKEEGRTIGLYLSLPLQVLIPLWYLAYRANRGRRYARLCLAFVLAYPVMSLLKLSRSDALFVVISVGVAEHYYRLYIEPHRAFRFRVGRVLRYAALGLAAMVALNSLLIVRAGLVAGGRGFADFIDLNIDAGPLSSTIGEIYGYIALPFENFANVLRLHLHGSYLGVGPTRPLFSLVGQSALADARMDRLDLGYVLILPINTYTFLTLIYVELGIAGVLIVPFLYALFFAALYRRFRNQPSLASLSLYLIFLPNWLFLFVTNGFSGLSSYLNAAFVLAVVVIERLLRVIQRAAASNAAARGYAS